MRPPTRLVLFLLLAWLLSGCADTTASSTAADPVVADTEDERRTVGDAPSADAPSGTDAPVPTRDPQAAAVFLAAVEDRLRGTGYEGLAEADPEGFVATGEIMCDLLTDGATVDEILTTYLTELGAERDVPWDDDADLSGAVLGAAVGALCPEHAGLLQEG